MSGNSKDREKGDDATTAPVQILRVGGDYAFRGLINSLTKAGSYLPVAKPGFHDLRRITDVPYGTTGSSDHLLDIYLPNQNDGLMPIVLYIHGGGFRFCSKDTHWIMALGFARQGFAVFNINYRLAPPHRFPAALEDCCAALKWVVDHARDYGCDPERIVLAGESAGANLATSLAIISSYRRPERWAREIWDAGIRPSAVAALCGILQVSHPERFLRKRSLNPWIWHRLSEPSLDYLPADADVDPRLADPLVFLEQGRKPRRKLPPFFISVGTRDPLLDDSRRLAGALAELGVEHEAHFYPGALHAFQAMIWDPRAREHWRHQFAFMNKTMGPLQRSPDDFSFWRSVFTPRKVRSKPGG